MVGLSHLSGMIGKAVQGILGGRKVPRITGEETKILKIGGKFGYGGHNRKFQILLRGGNRV